MADVFLLWHVSHARREDDGPVPHVDDWGVLLLDEQEGDNAKLLGIYSTRALAEDRIRRCASLPGFAEEPDCFFVDECTVDADDWTDGFVRLGPDDEVIDV